MPEQEPGVQEIIAGNAWTVLEDPPPQRQKLTVTIPRCRKSTRFATLLPASLHPSESTTESRPRVRGGGKKTTSVLGVAREHYRRKTDWKRRVFTKLHGGIRCLFCPPHPSLQSRGTINRLPDAAARHLRDSCAHFEESQVYARYRKRVGGRKLAKKQIVARVVQEYEKIAVAQVFCRQDEAHKTRCAELGLSPLDVEERLQRHAVLCKVEDCECCPHPSFSECLDKVNEDARKEKRKGESKQGKKKKLKHAVSSEGVHVKEEEEQEDVGIQDLTQTRLNSASTAADEEGQKCNLNLKRRVSDRDKEEEAEVDLVLKRRRSESA